MPSTTQDKAPTKTVEPSLTPAETNNSSRRSQDSEAIAALRENPLSTQASATVDAFARDYISRSSPTATTPEIIVTEQQMSDLAVERLCEQSTLGCYSPLSRYRVRALAEENFSKGFPHAQLLEDDQRCVIALPNGPAATFGKSEKEMGLESRTGEQRLEVLKFMLDHELEHCRWTEIDERHAATDPEGVSMHRETRADVRGAIKWRLRGLESDSLQSADKDLTELAEFRREYNSRQEGGTPYAMSAKAINKVLALSSEELERVRSAPDVIKAISGLADRITQATADELNFQFR